MFYKIKRMKTSIIFLLAIGLTITMQNAFATDTKKIIEPWGSASILNIVYKPQKVIFNVTTGNKAELKHILSRIAYLYKIEGSSPMDGSIIIILHGQSIPFFVIKHFPENEVIMQQAHSLTVGTPIEFRMCRAAAKSFGYKPKDIDGFVRMVPMADAEIVRLEHQGYAYMQ